jgi:hypothetical protein
MQGELVEKLHSRKKDGHLMRADHHRRLEVNGNQRHAMVFPQHSGSKGGAGGQKKIKPVLWVGHQGLDGLQGGFDALSGELEDEFRAMEEFPDARIRDEFVEVFRLPEWNKL